MTRLWLVPVLCAAACSSSPSAPVCAAERARTVPIGLEDVTFPVGPYLGHTTATTVAVGWETAAAGSTDLEYGPDAAYGLTATGPAGTMHQLVVSGLAPATVYHYRACTDGVCTADLTFSTTPERGQPFHFAVMADSQDNPDIVHTNVENMLLEQPIVVLVAGDIVGDGNVREQFKERFFDPARRLLHYLPIYVAAGNHEQSQPLLENFRDYLMFPIDPADPHETSYTAVWGDAFFLAVDTNDINFSPIISERAPLWQWITRQVASPAARAARWRFAFMHYPPDSRCFPSLEYPSTAVKDYVVPLLREHGFHALFGGHEHNYERLDYDGFAAFITGGGGGGLETPEACVRDVPESKAFAAVHHHLAVALDCDRAVVRAVGLDGVAFDEHVIAP
ncbi:MAG TPA: metallophosphoesterase [Polyangia bacterium]|jgi:hypothetical protein